MNTQILTVAAISLVIGFVATTYIKKGRTTND